MVEEGRSQVEVAQEFGVTRTAVNPWVQRYRSQGDRSLAARKQGRPKRPTLGPQQVATITRFAITARSNCSFPFALWTRQAVTQLLKQRWGCLERTTVVATYFAGDYRRRSRQSCPPAVPL